MRLEEMRNANKISERRLQVKGYVRREQNKIWYSRIRVSQ